MMRISLADLSARAPRRVRRRKTTRPNLESLEQRTLLAQLEVVQSSFLLTATLDQASQQNTTTYPPPSNLTPTGVEISQQETAALPVGPVSSNSLYQQQASVTAPVTFYKTVTHLSAGIGGVDQPGGLTGYTINADNNGSTPTPGVPVGAGNYQIPSGSISGSVTLEVIPDTGDDPNTLSTINMALDATPPVDVKYNNMKMTISYSGSSGQGSLTTTSDPGGSLYQQTQLNGLHFYTPIQLNWTFSAQGVAGSSGSIILSLDPQPLFSSKSTSTKIRALPLSFNVGRPVTLTATVKNLNHKGGAPIGEVAFLDGNTALGTAALRKGKASLRTSTLFLGPNPIQAYYVGSGGFASSKSTILTVTVRAHRLRTKVASSLALPRP